jgi:glycogen debranching enzyme
MLKFAAAWTAVLVVALAAPAQQPDERESVALRWSTRAVGPARTLAVHGRRGMMIGHATGGLEAWAYPFELFRDYRISIRVPSTGQVFRGDELLSRVDVEPSASTRVYLGPGFVLHEQIFLPLDQPAGIVTYTVTGAVDLEIRVQAEAIFDLMWPASLSGQGMRWDRTANEYQLHEPQRGFSALVGSPDTIAYSGTSNIVREREGIGDIDLTLRATRHAPAHFAWLLMQDGAPENASALAQLIATRDKLERQSAMHVRDVLKSAVRIETPDEDVNRALEWDVLALDQAWACNDDLGCGYVGGYGASHPQRRPQYAWYFAGDGLVAANAAVDTGALEQARAELEFILRYQNTASGMIWHELSQSAGWVDWPGKYPYMFAHVDISFEFLATAARYIRVSGDLAFLRKHRDGIEAAYRYCASLVDPATGLPRIPADKLGGNEQQALHDDLGLSTAWASAAESYAEMAALLDEPQQSERARQFAKRARTAIAEQYWDAKHSFWINGHRGDGSAFTELRSTNAAALELHLFTAAQRNSILRAVSGADFQTDWGVRSVSTQSPGYDAESYAQGSVWPVNTAEWATTLWNEGRSTQAFGLWRTLIPLHGLDALGHVHEVLSGDVLRAQRESVPEQTWSTAGSLRATVEGMLGIEVHGSQRMLHFSPHLPAQWDFVRIDQLHLPQAEVALDLERRQDALALTIRNDGEPFTMEFEPELPLGARLGRVTLNGRPLAAQLDQDVRHTQVRMHFGIPHGESHLVVENEGGVTVWWPAAEMQIGEPSHGIFVTDVRLESSQLRIEADVPCDRESVLYLNSVAAASHAEGAELQPVHGRVSALRIPAQYTGTTAYRHVELAVQFDGYARGSGGVKR